MERDVPRNETFIGSLVILLEIVCTPHHRSEFCEKEVPGVITDFFDTNQFTDRSSRGNAEP